MFKLEMFRPGFHCLILAFLTAGTSCAATPDSSGTPDRQEAVASEVVKQYCKLDFDGVRMSSDTWSQVLALITWEEEPGWDAITIVDGYQLGVPRFTDSGVEIPVAYSVVGDWSGAEYIPKGTTETVLFKLIRTGDSWKIEEPIIQPHVSVARTVKHLDELIRDISDRGEYRIRLEQIRQILAGKLNSP